MIDLHTHILPGIDDGAKDLRVAVEMCRLADADGCDVLIATPHQRHPTWDNTDAELLTSQLASLQEAVGNRPKLVSGGEIRVDSDFLEALDRLPASGLMSLAGSRYLLLEFGRQSLGPEPLGICHELSLNGWCPVVAHPELIPWLNEDFGLLERLVEDGVLLQVTAMSVMGAFGSQPKAVVERLFDGGMAHFVASDCHGVATRRPGLSRCFEMIRRRWGEETAWRLTTANPKVVLEDRPALEVA